MKNRIRRIVVGIVAAALMLQPVSAFAADVEMQEVILDEEEVVFGADNELPIATIDPTCTVSANKKGAVITADKGADVLVGVNAGVKVTLPSTVSYNVVAAYTVDEKTLSQNALDAKTVKKAAKVKNDKKGSKSSVVTVKAIKGIPTYYVVLESSYARITLSVNNVGFEKDIKKLALSSAVSANSVSDNMVSENKVQSVTIALTNGDALHTQIIYSYKSKAAKVEVSPEGYATITPYANAKGSVKIVYEVAGKKYATSVKVVNKALKGKAAAAQAELQKKYGVKVVDAAL